MHIKKIIIQGFKTYKNTTVIDVLSPSFNVVVGRNGSGKSNFFAAIRFVLSDAYTHMTREERQSLIHEGSGTVMSAYVEIIFDNRDRRFPISKDEIIIRRTIGLKKDDYSLDSKSATRSDIMNLLESAGFSRSNPYYIVPQGRITALTNSKDSERLALLKEVSGAKVFETKLKESIKEMNNSNNKRLRIDETLSIIEERLQDLQVEKDELKNFQSLEKNKKIFEFILFDREFNELNTEIETIDINYSDLLERSNSDLTELEKRERNIKELTDSINELNSAKNILQVDKEQADNDVNHFLTSLSSERVKFNELLSSFETNKSQTVINKKTLNQFNKTIKSKEDKIRTLKPQIENLQQDEKLVRSELNELTLGQRALYNKQSRLSKFANKSERDEWLNERVKNLNSELSVKSAQLEKVSSDYSSTETALLDVGNEISQLEESIEGTEYNKQIAEFQAQVSILKENHNDLIDQRKVLWREDVREKTLYESVQSDLKNAQQTVFQTMDRAQSSGLEAVRRIAQRLNLQGVYGQLGELFNVNDKYKTAVEVIAGNSLFHVVVDDDKTASILMDELIRERSGRVTFMPLNRLHPQNVNYPETSDAVPLIKKLKFDDVFIPAIKQVFGKAIVCISLQRGAELARDYKVSAITLDGDRADKKGVLTGGFIDHRKSRIDALKIQKRKKTELDKCYSKLQELRDEIHQKDQEITKAGNLLQSKTQELNMALSSKEPILAQLSSLRNKKYHITEDSNSLSASKEALMSLIHSLKTQISQHVSEMKSDFNQVLSDEEHNELSKINTIISSLEHKLDGIVTSLSSHETIISKLESELNDKYYPQRSQLMNESSENFDLVGNEIKQLEREIKKLDMQLNSAQSKAQQATDEFERINKKINEEEQSLKRFNDQQIKIMKKLESFQKTSEKNLSKRTTLLSRRDEIQRKIRELGVLPEEAFSTTNDSNSDDLLKKLNKVNKELSKYSHVNKKALEQFINFTKQRDSLAERRQELETSRESIEELINKLEQQKDDAITKNFQQLSKSFTEIFEKLVPAGIGHLVMQKRNHADADVDDIAEDEEENNGNGVGIENYIGVSVQVSFNSKEDDQQRIEQLSGGQKSLCAIALILAIQKCDPAPFYLFDEIDANLDAQYRTAVAALIDELSKDAQFICTTFRPEMLQVADKFYGVMFNNKVSTVSEIDCEDAMTFVEGQQQR